MHGTTRIASACMVAAAVILANAEASGCQPPEVRTVEEGLEEALGVVRAKVIGAEVAHPKELGIPCDAVHCDILSLQLQVLEIFKGRPGLFESIYAPVANMCTFSVNVGWEYVLFLEEFRGLTFVNDSSFESTFAGNAPVLTELRDLTAN